MEIGGSYWNRILINSKKRNLALEVSIKDIWDKFIKQNKKCALSGVELSFRLENRYDGTASIDRIDSTKGYTKENIQWIHKDLNRLKSNMTEDTLIKWCKLIVDNKT